MKSASVYCSSLCDVDEESSLARNFIFRKEAGFVQLTQRREVLVRPLKKIYNRAVRRGHYGVLVLSTVVLL